jgi:hypothetical protein
VPFNGDEYVPSSLRAQVTTLAEGDVKNWIYWPDRALAPKANALLSALPRVSADFVRTAIFSADGTMCLALQRKRTAENPAPASAGLWALRPTVREIAFTDPAGTKTTPNDPTIPHDSLDGLIAAYLPMKLRAVALP